MKTKYSETIRFILILLVAVGIATPMQAQHNTEPSYVVVNGIVKDKQSKKKLEHVSISIPGTSIGTVTNEDGVFSIKIKDSLQAKQLEISHLGYSNRVIPIQGNTGHEVTILLPPNENILKEVVIQAVDPLELVKEAIRKIADNNSPKTNMLTGFYRETVKKRRNYINISEAVIDVYKTPYTDDISRDKVQVYKGRQLLSPKPGDTLIVKFQGGPNLSTYLDVVKNREIILDAEQLHCYKFTMDNPVMIDERMHYVVKFQPQVVLPYALFYGKFYIDKESLAFSRAEFQFNMDDRNKVTQAILKKKPFKMHFKPEEVSYVVTYKQQEGRTYLNYVRNQVRFKCDLKRKWLFSTNYTIVSELVITDKKTDNVASISRKNAFNLNASLSDKVGNFQDPNFWEDYNIIEPSESLESAVTKLKKQQDER